MIQLLPYWPGVPSLFPARSAGEAIPLDAFANTMDGTSVIPAASQGIPGAKIYSHNLGFFLHQPGPLIGLPWEQQDTGPRGEVTLEYASAFVMELGTEGPVPEWGNAPLRLGTEEPVLFDRDGCRTLCPRQTE